LKKVKESFSRIASCFSWRKSGN